MGVVASLAHPGGNVTGLTFFAPELMAKRLGILKDLAPGLMRAGVLLLEDNPTNGNILDVVGAAAATLKIELRPLAVDGATDFANVLSPEVAREIGGLIMVDHAQLLSKAPAIAALAAKFRLPLIGAPQLAETGGLIGYGVEFIAMFRRAAVYVDKILKGAKPGDIPVEQAAKFKTIVNLKTAKAIGVEIPPLLLAGVDEVIE